MDPSRTSTLRLTLISRDLPPRRSRILENSLEIRNPFIQILGHRAASRPESLSLLDVDLVHESFFSLLFVHCRHLRTKILPVGSSRTQYPIVGGQRFLPMKSYGEYPPPAGPPWSLLFSLQEISFRARPGNVRKTQPQRQLGSCGTPRSPD